MNRTLIGGALPHKSSDLGHALARLRKNFYHPWQVLEELRSAPPQYSPPDALLREWRSAPKPSQEWRKALFYEQAVDVLAVALGLSREETEEFVRQYMLARRQTIPGEQCASRTWENLQGALVRTERITRASMDDVYQDERARALGGDFKIKSQPQRGTRVRFEMALEEDAEEPEEEVGVRVLLVEDHAAFRDALASTFQAEGFEVVGQAGSLKQAQSILEDSDHPKVRQTGAISARCRREQSSPSGLETADR